MLGSHSGFCAIGLQGLLNNKCYCFVATQQATTTTFLFVYTVVNCSNLDDPVNGQVEFTDTTVGSIANYTCNQRYILSNGNSTRTCEASGEWSGSPPSCERE